jgi:hypothetical protein
MTYTNKTVATKVSPKEFIQNQKEGLRHDALLLVSFYEKVTGAKCVMWNRIFGFGEYEYKDSKGGSHTYLAAGFAVSSTGFTLYNIMGWEKYKDELAHLGKYKLSGKSCLAIKKSERY